MNDCSSCYNTDKEIRTMIRTLYRSQSSEIQHDLSSEDISTALDDPQGLLWVDLEQEEAARSRQRLLDVFGFHPLAVDDALEERHVPKVDAWKRYIYLVLHAIQFHPDADHPVATLELDFFVD
jgi:magnesium transporter